MLIQRFRLRADAGVALALSGAYIDSIGGSADTDGYIDGRKVIDAKISYRINPHFTVFTELLNINEEPLKTYTGVASRNSGNEIYYWKARGGIYFAF